MLPNGFPFYVIFYEVWLYVCVHNSCIILVYLFKDPNKYVALKCFTNLMVNGKQRELSLQDLTLMYSDLRLELNKLSTVDHPYIVQFLGLCMVSFSLLLEWAPKGNLEQIITEYRLANTWICPDAVAKTVYQVSLYVTMKLLLLCNRQYSIRLTFSCKKCVHACSIG